MWRGVAASCLRMDENAIHEPPALAGAPVSVVSVFYLLEDYPIPVAFNLKLILYLILIHSS